MSGKITINTKTASLAIHALDSFLGSGHRPTILTKPQAANARNELALAVNKYQSSKEG